MKLWQRPDLVTQLLPNVDLDEVQRLRIEADQNLQLKKYQDIALAIDPLPMADEIGPIECDFSGDHVTIGRRENLTDEQFSQLETAIHALHPWRKGPFRMFDFEIDSEWRSNLKWDRIAPALGELRNRRILDVGCGNGYYMFRLAQHNPGVVLGLDPSVPFYLSFEMMQRYTQLENMQYERLGVQHLYVFQEAFDIALCMGILYHHPSPIDILRNLRTTLRKQGVAIIESQTIPGHGTQALFPEERYAKARNVYFMPTRDCMVNWVARAGFKNIEVISHTPVTTKEQRATDFMTFESLSDFLDPNDPQKTIEGYPAPYRTVIRAERKF